MIKERPLAFMPDMVCAERAGIKTMTRRIVKGSEAWPTNTHHVAMLETRGTAMAIDTNRLSYGPEIKCPYGKPGDRLYVREAYRAPASCDHTPPRSISQTEAVRFVADEVFGADAGFGKTRPAMFMCRWMSRTLLEITSVRVERLQEISRGDCMAEGCPFPNIAGKTDPVSWYRDLWEQINGPGSWALNPWVWAIEFKRIKS